MDNDRIAEYLISILGEDNVRRDEPMNVHTTFRIGGEADFFITPRTEKQILDVVTFLKKTDIFRFLRIFAAKTMIQIRNVTRQFMPKKPEALLVRPPDCILPRKCLKSLMQKKSNDVL